jgi:hypothetical protein
VRRSAGAQVTEVQSATYISPAAGRRAQSQEVIAGNNEEISTAGVDIRAERAEYEYLFKHSASLWESTSAEKHGVSVIAIHRQPSRLRFAKLIA